VTIRAAAVAYIRSKMKRSCRTCTTPFRTKFAYKKRPGAMPVSGWIRRKSICGPTILLTAERTKSIENKLESRHRSTRLATQRRSWICIGIRHGRALVLLSIKDW
jgi:hypothetical protein